MPGVYLKERVDCNLQNKVALYSYERNTWHYYSAEMRGGWVRRPGRRGLLKGVIALLGLVPLFPPRSMKTV